jgi:hypothetical protein
MASCPSAAWSDSRTIPPAEIEAIRAFVINRAQAKAQAQNAQ